MSQELILITGSTGHVGSRVLATALEAGYRVRASIRRAEQSEGIKNAASVKPYVNNVEFVVVPDITVEGAFDEALKDVSAVIHVASPLAKPSDDLEKSIVNPAVKGTTSILNSAAKVKSIRRMVITSSIVAVVADKYVTQIESDEVFNGKSTTALLPGPYTDVFATYSISKVAALHATNDFVEKQKPHFDIINICPSFVIGANELVTSVDKMTDGTNGVALRPLLGVDMSAMPMPGVSVHVNDVATAHVRALDTKLLPAPHFENFITSSQGPEGTVWQDAIDIVKQKFPEQKALPLTGTQPTKKFKIDSSRTEQALGYKHASYKEQVESVVEHYIRLAAASA